MAFCTLNPKNILIPASFVFMAMPLALFTSLVSASAQSPGDSSAGIPNANIALSYSNSRLPNSVWSGSDKDSSIDSADPALLIPASPEPAAFRSRKEYTVEPSGTGYQRPFSRIGIGSDVSPLGFGVKSAIILDHLFDARIMGNLFSYNSSRFELYGFNTKTNLHMRSAAASLDWYPFDSIWRISPGLLFFNDNQLSITTAIVPGTSFSLNGQTFYSASTNAATGATPLIGTGVLGLHSSRPAFTIAGGPGKFIPRSDRHLSFPFEIGVAFTGAPSANENVSGWACLDAAQTQCGNVAGAASPVAIQFNNALQATLSKLRNNLHMVEVYPLLSYSVVYSFNIRPAPNP